MDFKLRKLPGSILALNANEITQEKRVGRVFQLGEGGVGRSSPSFPPEMPLDICLEPRLQWMFEQKPPQLCASLGQCVLQARNLKAETEQSTGSRRKGDYWDRLNQEFTAKTSPGMSCRNFCSSTRLWHLWEKGSSSWVRLGLNPDAPLPWVCMGNAAGRDPSFL